MSDSNKETITSALGISTQWEDTNVENIINLLQDEVRVSDAMIKHAKQVKAEEFGVDIDTSLSLYEKKLIWSGMEIAKILIRQRPMGIPNPVSGGFDTFLKLIHELGAVSDESTRTRKPRRKKED
jgi:hypothetical protein